MPSSSSGWIWHFVVSHQRRTQTGELPIHSLDLYHELGQVCLHIYLQWTNGLLWQNKLANSHIYYWKIQLKSILTSCRKTRPKDQKLWSAATKSRDHRMQIMLLLKTNLPYLKLVVYQPWLSCACNLIPLYQFSYLGVRWTVYEPWPPCACNLIPLYQFSYLGVRWTVYQPWPSYSYNITWITG